MAGINDPSTGTPAKVDTTPQALRTILYGPNGEVVSVVNRATIAPATQSGLMNLAADYKTARLVRASSAGTLRTSDDTLFLFDTMENTLIDTTKWVLSNTTMTVAQTAALGQDLNNAGTLTAATGVQQSSHARFPIIPRTGLVIRYVARPGAHFNGNLHEIGFGNPAGATTVSISDGAVWRKLSTSGEWAPVVSFNGNEFVGTLIPDATFISASGAQEGSTNNFCTFEVIVYDDHAQFSIYGRSGTLRHSQDIDYSSVAVASTPSFTATRLRALHRTVNIGVVSTAVHLWVKQVAVFGIDSMSQRPWVDAMAANIGYGPLVAPTTVLQAANLTNSAAPASATLSNTAAGYTTMGGLWQAVLVAAAETDYDLFAYNVLAPFKFMITGIKISQTYVQSLTTGFTAPLVLQWSLAINHSAASLATGSPYPPMRTALGIQAVSGVAVATVGTTVGNDIVWQPTTPLPVFPDRFISVILRLPVVGAAGTACVIRGTVTVDGYYE